VKICAKCDLEKDLSLFHKDNRSDDKLTAWCGDCNNLQSRTYRQVNKEKHRAASKRWYEANKEHDAKRTKAYRKASPDKLRAWHVRTKYGLTPEQYNAMLIAQNDSCAACNTPRSEMEREICVDHNKKTNVVRGLLCHGCNTAFGLLKEDERTIMRLLEYARKHK